VQDWTVGWWDARVILQKDVDLVEQLLVGVKTFAFLSGHSYAK